MSTDVAAAARSAQVVILGDSDDEDDLQVVSVRPATAQQRAARAAATIMGRSVISVDDDDDDDPLSDLSSIESDNASPRVGGGDGTRSDSNDEGDVRIVAVRERRPPVPTITAHISRPAQPLAMHRSASTPRVSTIINFTAPFFGSNAHPNSRIRELSPPLQPAAISSSKTALRQPHASRTLASLPPRPPSPEAPSLKCAICLSTPEKLVSTVCGHMYCEDCLTDALTRGAQGRRCPICRKPIPKKNGYHPLYY
ncbi:hypothetical protein RI367_000673 [Sorochytrium milnesiophthora]